MAKIAFTAGRVSGFRCPPEKAQAFLWDVTTRGLGLRATPAGKPSYVFQSEFQGKTIRLVIGAPDAWRIPQAQEKARHLQRMIDQGTDPRTLKRDALAAAAEQAKAAAERIEAEKVAALTVGDAWAVYLTERYGTEFATIISDTVARWDASEASRRIELQVGRDLQFIRINGTVVGSLAGLVIYTFAVVVLG